MVLTAADGERAAAQFTPAGRRAPAVVLLHENRGGPDQWDGLVPYLHEAGFATLAYKSRSSPMEAERMPDLVAALDWLRSRPRQVDPERIGLVGSSIGGSTTVLAMAADARKVAAAAVALSPPDASDIWALQDDGRYRPHDVLFIADDREVASAEDMMDGAVRSEVVTTTVRGRASCCWPSRRSATRSSTGCGSASPDPVDDAGRERRDEEVGRGAQPEQHGVATRRRARARRR